MLCISRWKAAAILLTVLSVSAMAIPNFLSEKAFRMLPQWAQHRIVAGIEFQGGSRFLMEVDTVAAHQEMVQQLREKTRNVLRQAKLGLVQAAVIRGLNVEVRVRENDLPRALAILHDELVLPPAVTAAALKAARAIRPAYDPRSTLVSSFTTVASVPVAAPEVTVESRGGGLIRLTVTESAARDRALQGRQPALDIIRRRIKELGIVNASVEPRGADRIEVVLPGVTRLSRLQY